MRARALFVAAAVTLAGLVTTASPAGAQPQPAPAAVTASIAKAAAARAAGLSWDGTRAKPAGPTGAALIAPPNPTFNGAFARGYGVTLWVHAQMPTVFYGGYVFYPQATATTYTGNGPGFGNMNWVTVPPGGLVVTVQVWFTPLGGAAHLLSSQTMRNGFNSHGWMGPDVTASYGQFEVGPGYYTFAFSAAVNNHGPAGPGSVGWGDWYDYTVWLNS